MARKDTKLEEALQHLAKQDGDIKQLKSEVERYAGYWRSERETTDVLGKSVNALQDEVKSLKGLRRENASLKENLHRCLGWIAHAQGKPPIEEKDAGSDEHFRTVSDLRHGR